MKQICVFCGSSMGNQPSYRNAAVQLGLVMAEQKMGLVYGGANVGIMKVLAETMLEKGMKVIGVMPDSLVEKEVAHRGLTELIIVSSMAARKEKMVELSDAFIAMPGGFGTLDELSEIMTYNQLRITDKPMGLLNIDGFFDALLRFYDHAVQEGFVRKEHRDNLIVSDGVTDLLARMSAYRPVGMGKWIEDIMKESKHTTS